MHAVTSAVVFFNGLKKDELFEMKCATVARLVTK